MRFSFDQSGVTHEEIHATAERLRPYLARLRGIAGSGAYLEAESSLCLPSDAVLYAEADKLISTLGVESLKYIAVVGIGGSNLGTKAVYDALRGYSGVHAGKPAMLFFETTDAALTRAQTASMQSTCGSESEFLIVIISKSGQTTETMAHAEALVAALKEKFPNVEKRVVAITDEDSALWNEARTRGLPAIAIPKQVGGRYSVFSAVGLVPLKAAGFDTKEFASGAREMLETCFAENEESPLLQGVAFFEKYMNARRNIHDLFFFSPRLESVGKWCRQLIAESLGKDGKGVTPTVSVGSTDLHSMFQLYSAGPKDKFTLFVSAGDDTEARVPSERMFPEILPHIAGRSFYDITNAIRTGTMNAYGTAGLPYGDVSLDTMNERELGAFMQWQMVQTMCLGFLMGVDTFDQHSVQSYKEETIRILKHGA